MSYAGVHCQTKRWKTYAVGVGGSKWRPVEKPVWEEIEKKTQENYRHDLYKAYACAGNGPAGSVKQVLANLRAPEKVRNR